MSCPVGSSLIPNGLLHPLLVDFTVESGRQRKPANKAIYAWPA